MKYPSGATFEKKSFSVIENPGKTEFTVVKGNGNLVLSNQGIKIKTGCPYGEN